MSNYPHITGQRLASVLVARGIVQAAAVDDPDGYDGSQTLMAINAAAEDLQAIVVELKSKGKEMELFDPNYYDPSAP